MFLVYVLISFSQPKLKLKGFKMSVNIPTNNNNATIPSLPVNNAPAPQAQPVGANQFGNAAPMYKHNTAQGNQQTSGVNEKQHPFLSLRALNRQQSLMSRAPIAEVVKKFREAVDKFSKEAFEKKGITVIDFNASENIKISALIFVVTDGAGAGSRAAYHTVLLGSSMTSRVSQDYTVDKITFTRVGLPTDAWEEEMQRAVHQEVMSRYPHHQIVFGAASTIPESFDYNNETAIQLVILNATNACQSQLWKTDPGATYLVIGQNFKGTFRSEIKSSWENQVNIYGSPVRSDVVLELYDTTTEKNNQNNNNPDAFRINDPYAAQLVSNITGYIDLMWNPVQFNPAMMYGGNLQGQIPEFGPYSPRFIITQLDQIIGTDIVSMLISLATTHAMTVVGDTALKMIIKQHDNGAKNSKSDGLDIRDLGALGYDHNPNDVNSVITGAKINTRDLAQGSMELVTLIKSLIRTRQLTIAIDIEECGPSSWAQGVLYNAAIGDKDAYAEIITAANLLTNNHFSKFHTSGQIIYDDNCRINLGWYLDSAGVRRDIRDVDMVTMFNVFGATNVAEARDWSNHQSASNSDMHLRCALMRDKIKNTLLKPEFEGYARRLTFDANFLDALAAGIHAAGLVFQTSMGDSNPLGGLRATLPFLSTMNHTMAGASAFVQRQPWNQNVQGSYVQRGIGVNSAGAFGNQMSY